jgi:hypothetical protein
MASTVALVHAQDNDGECRRSYLGVTGLFGSPGAGITGRS